MSHRDAQYYAFVAGLLDSDAELRGVVERARARLVAGGEVGGPSTTLRIPELSGVAQQALLDWVRSGEYRRAVQAISADDPDLADQ